MQIYYAFLDIPRFTNNFVKSLKKSFAIPAGEIKGFNQKSISALTNREGLNATTIILDKEFFDIYTCQNSSEEEMSI